MKCYLITLCFSFKIYNKGENNNKGANFWENLET